MHLQRMRVARPLISDHITVWGVCVLVSASALNGATELCWPRRWRSLVRAAQCCGVLSINVLAAHVVSLLRAGRAGAEAAGEHAEHPPRHDPLLPHAPGAPPEPRVSVPCEGGVCCEIHGCLLHAVGSDVICGTERCFEGVHCSRTCLSRTRRPSPNPVPTRAWLQQPALCRGYPTAPTSCPGRLECWPLAAVGGRVITSTTGGQTL
jgi:hypothetical protein